MVKKIYITRKTHNFVFITPKAFREILECYKAKQIKFWNYTKENESKKFKKNTRDFLKKSSTVSNYSLNNLCQYIALVNVSKTLIGNTITAIGLLKNSYPEQNKLSFQNKNYLFKTY